MSRRTILKGVAALAILTAPAASLAQDSVKIGLILPMTGQQASTGKQISAAVRLYMQENGTSVAGKKVEVIIKDDGAVPDNTKRLAQELIVNDKVSVIAGFGVTPAALGGGTAGNGSQGGRARNGGRHIDHHGTVALYRPHEFHRCRSPPSSLRIGRQRTASRRWSRSSPTMPRAPMPKNRSANASRPPEARSWRQSKCPCQS